MSVGNNSVTEVENCKIRKECHACCLAILKDYNLFKIAYWTLYAAYKFILTISIIFCERCFSALKFIKNRLGNTVIEEHFRDRHVGVPKKRHTGKFKP